MTIENMSYNDFFRANINLLSENDVETYEVGDNKDVIIVIYVPMAKREQKPVYINNDIFNGTFRRNYEGDYHCTQVKTMLRDQTERTMDMEVLVKVPYKMSGGERIDDTPVHKALREALANCLINADYHGLRGVVIRKEPDKLVLANPGYIRTGKKQMCLGGESDPRNKALMKMFNLINIGERAGSGVPNIFNVWEDEGWEEPVIEERFDPDRTVLSLSFKKSGDKKAAIKSGDKKSAIKSGDKKVTKKTQMQYDKILGFMEEGKEYGIWDFCELLGLKESRTKDILKGLSDYIDIIGSNRDRRYKKK